MPGDSPSSSRKELEQIEAVCKGHVDRILHMEDLLSPLSTGEAKSSSGSGSSSSTSSISANKSQLGQGLSAPSPSFSGDPGRFGELVAARAVTVYSRWQQSNLQAQTQQQQQQQQQQEEDEFGFDDFPVLSDKEVFEMSVQELKGGDPENAQVFATLQCALASLGAQSEVQGAQSSVVAACRAWLHQLVTDALSR
jgi:hypothetical protein